MKKSKKNIEIQESAYVTKLENEIKDLRRENDRLRKQVAIVNFFDAASDRLEYLELRRSEKEAKEETLELREKWLCNDCGRDSLHIHLFDMPNNKKKYYRACPHCNKRTPMKDFHNKVRGLFAEKKK